MRTGMSPHTICIPNFLLVPIHVTTNMTRVGCCKEMLVRRAGSTFSANGGAPLHPVAVGERWAALQHRRGLGTIQPVEGLKRALWHQSITNLTRRDTLVNLLLVASLWAKAKYYCEKLVKEGSP